MLETAIGDSAENLRLQEEITESSGVDADIRALLVDTIASGCSVGLLAVGGSGVIGGDLLVGVIDEILFGRHGDELVELGVELRSCKVDVASTGYVTRKMSDS